MAFLALSVELRADKVVTFQQGFIYLLTYLIQRRSNIRFLKQLNW